MTGHDHRPPGRHAVGDRVRHRGERVLAEPRRAPVSGQVRGEHVAVPAQVVVPHLAGRAEAVQEEQDGIGVRHTCRSCRIPGQNGPVPTDTSVIINPDTYTSGVPYELFAELRARAAVVWVDEPAI